MGEERVGWADVMRVDRRGRHIERDPLVVEEPLQIRLGARHGPVRAWITTMRTPGDDRALALGLLHSEGFLAGAREIVSVQRPADPRMPRDRRHNTLDVRLERLDGDRLRASRRPGIVTASCGVCGRQAIDDLRHWPPIDLPRIPDVAAVARMREHLAAAQVLFPQTGGLHAAALFGEQGELVSLHEDVGRHNALDKLVGAALDEGRLPLRGQVVLVSGRLGFELVQKCIAAGASALIGLGAPSTLAVDLADAFDLPLIGFARDDRYNLYSGYDGPAAALT